MPLSKIDRRLHKAYTAEYEKVEEYSRGLENLVGEALRSSRWEVQVTSRAKSPHSLLGKLRRKAYSDSAGMISDLIGVRVIAYYQDDVDRVVELLRDRFDIDAARSVDQRRRLAASRFGYQSVHLVAFAPELNTVGVERPTTVRCFEIQVRSFLEHAWAEADHEITYKSGIRFPRKFTRRFAAIAGALDIIDREFIGLRDTTDKLVSSYRDGYASGSGRAAKLDAARLAGLLEHVAPGASDWRSSETMTGREFSLRDAAVCVEALARAGLSNARALLVVLRAPAYERLRDSYAALAGISSDAVSHLAISLLAVAAEDRSVLVDFPDLLEDETLRRAITGR